MDDIEFWNALSTLNYMRAKGTPAKTWWDAPVWHPAVSRALKIDRQQEGGVFALSPFRLATIDGKHVILAAYPAPRILGPVDDDWLSIEAVIAWNPLTDEATVLGDPEPQTVGGFTDTDHGAIYASPLEYFQSWAIARAAFYVRWCASRKGEWAHGVTETDLIPGALALGPLDNIRWRDLPASIEARGIDPMTLNRAILRQANLPRAYAPQRRVAA